MAMYKIYYWVKETHPSYWECEYYARLFNNKYEKDKWVLENDWKIEKYIEVDSNYYKLD